MMQSNLVPLTRVKQQNRTMQNGLPAGCAAVLLAGSVTYWLSRLIISPSSTSDVAAAAAPTVADDEDGLAGCFFSAAALPVSIESLGLLSTM